MERDYDYNHPHAAADDRRMLEEYSEEIMEREDERANEMHDLSELF